MPHEGERVTAVRDLTPEEASIIGNFPRARETVPGLELDSGAVIFPSGDEEGNHPGEWPVSREELEEYVGRYVAAFTAPEGRDEGPHGSRPPLGLVLATEEPEIGDDGKITVNGEETVLFPQGRGAGPATWFVRQPVDEDERPDPEETPTPEEVMDMRVSGEIDQDEYSDLIAEAEKAHSDAVFSSIA